MPVYKDDKRGTWYCKIRYTDWQGNRKETTRRGFATKREAKEYEAEYLNKMAGSADMTLQSLFDIYIEDRQHKIKESSLIGITTSMNRHVLPSLGKMPLSKITPNIIRKWQNQLEKATTKNLAYYSETSKEIKMNEVYIYRLFYSPYLSTFPVRQFKTDWTETNKTLI